MKSRQLKGIFPVLAAVLIGCATQPKVTGAQAPEEFPEKVIDAHVHTLFTGKPERMSGIPQTR